MQLQCKVTHFSGWGKSIGYFESRNELRLSEQQNILKHDQQQRETENCDNVPSV